MTNWPLYKMAISQFQNFGFLIPKNQNFYFRKKQKNKIFEDIQKARISSIELYNNSQCTNFQANILIFGCAMVQQPGKADDVTVSNAIFGISNCRTSKTNDIFGILRKTRQDRQV